MPPKHPIMTPNEHNSHQKAANGSSYLWFSVAQKYHLAVTSPGGNLINMFFGGFSDTSFSLAIAQHSNTCTENSWSPMLRWHDVWGRRFFRVFNQHTEKATASVVYKHSRQRPVRMWKSSEEGNPQPPWFGHLINLRNMWNSNRQEGANNKSPQKPPWFRHLGKYIWNNNSSEEHNPDPHKPSWNFWYLGMCNSCSEGKSPHKSPWFWHKQQGVGSLRR